jgi:anti-anti-sigma factor
MAADALRRIRLDQLDDVTVVSFVDARIVSETDVEEIGKELYRLVEKQGFTRLVLNFGRVQALSSSMLGKLAALKKKALAAGGDVKLCSIHTDLMVPFDGCRFEKVVAIYKDEQSAIDSF